MTDTSNTPRPVQKSSRTSILEMRFAQPEQPHYPLSNTYRESLADLTDDYQITQAYAHWKNGTANKEAVFHYYFRNNPFEGGYAIACGLTHLIDYVIHYQWSDEMLEGVAAATGNDGKRLYEGGFIDYLRNLKLTVDIDAVKEGSVVFANEPLIRVRGPIGQGHLIETPLLNLNNFATLCATKASRIVLAADGKPVSDQSLRRDQGVDGSLTAAWATFVGGFGSTSNRKAARLFGIPCKGTMAHAMVMAHVDELEAFLAYAAALPNNCVFLVDTYNSIEGVKKAIVVARKLRERGYEVIGIRLDSGDLAYLSREARKLLDAAGFPNAKVFVSNDLDERIIESLNAQGAMIDAYGVGTKVGTCYDQPALGGVFKIGAWRNSASENWHFPIKLSEQAAKVSTPGIQQIRRFYNQDGVFISDAIFNEADAPRRALTMVDPYNPHRERKFARDCYAGYEDLLVPITRGGKVVYTSPNIYALQAYAKEQLGHLDASHKRFEHPHQYPVGLEKKLYRLKNRLIKNARKAA